MKDYGEGFITEAQSRNINEYFSFWDLTKNLVFFSIYLALSCIFFLFWISSPRKQEYSYMAFWNLVLAATQIKSTVYFSLFLGSEQSYLLSIVLRTFEGTFALFCCLSFARAKRDFFTYGIPGFLLGGIFLGVMSYGSPNAILISRNIGLYFVTTAYFIGSLFCFLQAYVLYSSSHAQSKPVRRISKLLIYGLLTSILGIIYLYSAPKINTPNLILLYRIVPVILVAFLSALVLLDYRNYEKAALNANFTRYHLPQYLNKKVKTCLLQIDIKGSTRLAKELEQIHNSRGIHLDKSPYKILTNQWYARVTALGTQYGAEILSSEGDLVLFSFDYMHCSNPIDNIANVLEQLPSIHTQVQSLLGLNSEIHIRGSVVAGDDLMAEFKSVGTKNMPGFDGDVFIYSKRLMDIEKSLEDAKDKSLVLIDPSLMRELKEAKHLQEQLLALPIKVMLDSDQRERKFKVIDLQSLETKKSRLAA
jgi:hypothetical protein